MTQRIDCAAGVHTGCGRSVDEETDAVGKLVCLTPYVCPGCYRSGWRAEGLSTRPAELRVGKLPPEKTPHPVPGATLDSLTRFGEDIPV